MTNFIKKIIAAVTLLGVVSITPAFAECKLGELTQYQEIVKDTPDVKIIGVPDTAVKTFVEKVGEPPNTDTTKPYQMYIMSDGSLASILVVQGGCVTVTAGPGPLEKLKQMMGLSDA